MDSNDTTQLSYVKKTLIMNFYPASGISGVTSLNSSSYTTIHTAAVSPIIEIVKVQAIDNNNSSIYYTITVGPNELFNSVTKLPIEIALHSGYSLNLKLNSSQVRDVDITAYVMKNSVGSESTGPEITIIPGFTVIPEVDTIYLIFPFSGNYEFTMANLSTSFLVATENILDGTIDTSSIIINGGSPVSTFVGETLDNTDVVTLGVTVSSNPMIITLAK